MPNLRPLNGLVFILPDRPKKTVGGTFFLAPKYPPWPTSGRVLASGTDEIKAGERVVFDYRDASNVRSVNLDGRDVLLFPADRIQGVLRAINTEKQII